MFFHSFHSLVVRLIGLTRRNNVLLNNAGSLNVLPRKPESAGAGGKPCPFRAKNLLPMLGDETLLEVVGDNSCESTRIGIDGSSERDFTIKLFALNSKGSY
jgi:hypothetical protein